MGKQKSAGAKRCCSYGKLLGWLSSAGRPDRQIQDPEHSWRSRLGLVWDGLHRILYVDGVAVAKDTQNGLEGSEMGLYLGTGKGMELGTFFSGRIDDARICNRVVSPSSRSNTRIG